jgi:hypothetical protein
VLWLVPRLGVRAAELLEMPFMLAVVVLAARWTVRRPGTPLTPRRRIGVGVVALALLLVVELTVVLWLRGLTLKTYLAQRDPVAGTAYLVMLGLFALMPLLVGRPEDRRTC